MEKIVLFLLIPHVTFYLLRNQFVIHGIHIKIFESLPLSSFYVQYLFSAIAFVLQPVFGYFFDKRPSSWYLVFALLFPGVATVLLTISNTIPIENASYLLILLGISTFYPEASRIVYNTSKGNRVFGQAIFQVGILFGYFIFWVKIALSNFSILLPDIYLLLTLTLISIFVVLLIKRNLSFNSIQEDNIQVDIAPNSFSPSKTAFVIFILFILAFSKFFYLDGTLRCSILYFKEILHLKEAQAIFLMFLYLIFIVKGLLLGAFLGEKVGHMRVIRFSTLVALLFALPLPYPNLLPGSLSLVPTIWFYLWSGFLMASSLPSILTYALVLVPKNTGAISGLFYGLTFGLVLIAISLIDLCFYGGLQLFYLFFSVISLLGLLAYFLPNLQKVIKERM